MFLDTVITRNPRLVETAAALHQDGAVPPDTYLVDLDAVEDNAAMLATRARQLGLSLWFVAKQFGRNPELVAAVARHVPRFAAIDWTEARALRAAGAEPGNLGHLVQVPRRQLPEALAWRPQAVTVFDLANARAVSDAAQRLGLVQDVLVRVEGDQDTVYPGQEGGVPVDRVGAFAERAERLPGVRIAGVTGFPCVLSDPATGEPRPTATFDLVLRARDVLAGRGLTEPVVSAPSATSMATLPLLARLGATHGEPGHALTGTTPLHAVDPGQPETPAYVYVSEVAHVLADGRPALFGGGFYPRSGIRTALLPRTGLRLPVQDAPAENIDYYRLLDAPPPAAGAAEGEGEDASTARGATQRGGTGHGGTGAVQHGASGGGVRLGDTAVLAFRTQVFVTRSTVAVVAGLSSGRPRLVGLYDSRGRALTGDEA